MERKIILIEEERGLKQKLRQLALVEKEFGYTEDVKERRNGLNSEKLKIKEQLLDFRRAISSPRVEKIKIIDVGFSKIATKTYSFSRIFLIILMSGIALFFTVLYFTYDQRIFFLTT